MHRRNFIVGTTSLAAWTLAALPAAQAQAKPALQRRKLIVVMLRGAVDGLSVVAPYGEAAYAASRGSIALAPPGAVAGGLLGLNSLFGLHPALARLMPMWEGGSLSFVHASGSPDASRSHFDAQDYLESGTPGRKSTPDGWMNRLLSGLPGLASPTRGVNMGNTPPRIWAGSASVANLGLGPRALDQKAIDSPRLQAALGRLYAQDPPLAKTLSEGAEGRAEIQRSMAGPVGGDRAMDGDRGAPSARSFAADARRLGQLIRRDTHTQLAFTSVGGWDTHVNQGGAEGQLANKLASLAEGLDALALGLGEAMRDTVIVVCSEFGRTLSQNGTGGTDHGRGNVMWLLGGPVAGGRVLGDWPGLDSQALADGRDLAVTTDFRQVFAPLLQRHLGLSDAGLAQVFPAFETKWTQGAALLKA